MSVEAQQNRHARPAVPRPREIRWDRADLAVAIAMVWLSALALYGILTRA